MSENTDNSGTDDADTSYLGHTELPEDTPESEADLALSEQAKRVQAQREGGDQESDR